MKSSMQEVRNRALKNPIWFCRAILRINPDPWQEELLESLADIVRYKANEPTKYNHEGKTQVTIRAMHGPGKTFGLALCMHWFGFCFMGVIPCTAPKASQVKTRLFKEFAKINSEAIKLYSQLTEQQATAIYWKNGEGKLDKRHLAWIETAAQPENLAGIHDDYVMVLIDEASGVNESLWPVIDGIVSTGKIAIVIMVSNPTKTSGTFAMSHLSEKMAPYYHRIHISLDKTPRVSRSWVNKMINRYGERSPVVKIRCYGEFAESSANQLIPLTHIEDARSRLTVDIGESPTLVISIDVADGGTAFTVFTVANHYNDRIKVLAQIQKSYEIDTATTDAAKDAMSLLGNYVGYEDYYFVVDSVGVGTGVASELISNDYNTVRFKGGAKSSDSKVWRDARTQCYCLLRDLFANGLIEFDSFENEEEWADIVAQLSEILMDHGRETVEAIETKMAMLKRLGWSPDRADSLMMQLAKRTPLQQEVVGNIVVR